MTLAEFLARFAEVREERDGYVVPCPAHDDSHPSLRVALSDRGNLILRCRRGCDTTAVVEAMGLRYRDLFDVKPGDGVKTTAAQTAAVGVRETAALARYLDDVADRLLDPEDETAAEALDYAASRFGVDRATAKALGLGVDPGGEAHPLEWRGRPYARVPRLVVPFRDFDGVPRGVQARDLSGADAVRWCGLTNPEGMAWSRIAVFDLHTGLDTIVLTEGPGDALTAAAVGYDAVAIRGAALAGNAERLDDLVPHLRDRRVVVAGDRDEAGDTFASRVAARLADHGLQVHVLQVPDDPEDGDLSGWRKHDPDAFPAALHRAIREARLVDSTATTAAPTTAAPGTTAPTSTVLHPLTDLGNAKRLYDHLGGLVRYAPETGFYLYRDGVWVLDRLDEVRTHAHDVAVALATAPPVGSTGPQGMESWSRRSQSTRSIDSMIRELSALPGVAVDVEHFDARHDLLAVGNGTVNLRTGDLRPHSPADLLTRRIAVDYKPDAPCPTWDYFLSSVFPSHPDLPDFVRRLVGYGITGHTSEQCFAVLWGTGANGKSVFTDTLTHVFRSITTTTPFSTFEAKPNGGIPNDLAALKGARLVMASEGEQGKTMAEAVIKRITGRDMISARFMRREFFEFAPTFLIFLATNYKPNFRGQDEGLWRRVKLIPWERYFRPEERDHYLGDRLRDEAEGILAWAVRGAREWYAQGLGEPSVVVDATRDYRETADFLQGFLPGVLVREEGAELLGADAYTAFREWAEEEGLQAREVWTRKTFYGALDERGVPRQKRERGVYLQGVRFAEPRAHSSHLPPSGSAPAQGDPGPTAPALPDYRPEASA